ncbi:unnamed protein product [Paramecium octaurelia]|uniref:Uncharacterized protein n=1 Tax=Paramecium octaurelia TaxID=43137 RepID=A0A8S1XQU0_PAROT|nr:unnamed protein product [Paramecium octaurelia]
MLKTSIIHIWHSTCEEKTWVNAPTSNNNHDQCTTYLSTYTVNQKEDVKREHLTMFLQH